MGVRCNGFKENQTSEKVGFVTTFLAWFQVEHPFCERLERDRKMWHIYVVDNLIHNETCSIRFDISQLL